MNISDMDLNSEENKKKITSVLQQLKMKALQEEKKCQEEEVKKKEFEEKCYLLSQQKQQLDQKLAKTEISFKRKAEDLLEAEQKISDLQNKIDILISNQTSKKSLFGFGHDETSKLKKEIYNLQLDSQIKESELLKTHELLFDTKKQQEQNEKKFEEQINKLSFEIKRLIEVTQKDKLEKEELELQIQNHLQIINEKDQKIQQYKVQLNNIEDQVHQLTEQLEQQKQQQNDLQNTLVHKKDELKKIFQEADLMKDNLNQIKETLYNILPQLENEQQNSLIIMNLKQFVEKMFGVDKQKDQKLIQVKQEQELQKELLYSKDSYQVFQKAKDKILKLGKQIEQLEKKNKLLQDKIFILENRRIQPGKTSSELYSDKISTI